MRAWRAAVLPGAVLACLACDPGPAPPTLDLPPRPADAPGGAAIVRDLGSLDFPAWEERIHAEVARGNVPARLRRLQQVELTADVDGRARRVTFWAMPDYLSVGSDEDFFLVPLSPRTARRIAELVGGALPTPSMVDAIWAAARVRLTPIRFRPDEFMGTIRYFERHNSLVRAQQRQRRVRSGDLVAGHKLDVVVTAARDRDPAEPADAFALYGWHLSDGTPIQPVQRVPADGAPHFSMGVRVVHREILVDGAIRDLEGVMRDPGLAGLLASPWNR